MKGSDAFLVGVGAPISELGRQVGAIEPFPLIVRDVVAEGHRFTPPHELDE